MTRHGGGCPGPARAFADQIRGPARVLVNRCGGVMDTIHTVLGRCNRGDDTNYKPVGPGCSWRPYLMDREIGGTNLGASRSRNERKSAENRVRQARNHRRPLRLQE